MLEKHELQYVSSAAVRKDVKPTTTPTDQRGDQNKKSQQGKNKFQKFNRAPSQTATSREAGSASVEPAQSASVQKSSGNNRPCFVYKKSPSYSAKECQKREAPGRGKPSSTTSMVVPVPLQQLEEMTDEQLEDILVKRKLEREKELLQEVAQVDMIQAREGLLGAVGPLLSLKVKIGRSRSGCNGGYWITVNGHLTFNVAQNWKISAVSRKRLSNTEQTSFTSVWKRWKR